MREDNVSPLENGLQLLENGSGSNNVAVAGQFGRILTEPLKHNV